MLKNNEELNVHICISFNVLNYVLIWLCTILLKLKYLVLTKKLC